MRANLTPPTIQIYMTRLDAEVWHFDEVRVDSAQFLFMDDPDIAEDTYEKIRSAVKEAFYEMGYVFDDDPPIRAEPVDAS